jgi:uncharacterized membrane-anchored protein
VTLRKVPAITAAFWVMKICATTLGETAGDLFSMTLNVGYALSTVLLLGIFAAALAAQLASRRYHPWLYWTVILATSTAGTTASDFMDRTLALGYATGAAILVTLLGAVLLAWRLDLGTISVDHIETRRAEGYYWAAILVSNTLGTAFGDFLADDSGLGFGGGAVLIGATLAVLLALSRYTSLSRVGLFWAAFVLTRPFGAAFGDLMSKSREQGGLGFGTVIASAVLASILVSAIAWSSRTND